MKPVESKQEITNRLAELPEFSRSVYRSVQESMYAEPGFSDTMPQDIALWLKTTKQAIGGALTTLQEAGLIWLDTNGVNGKPMTFIHTYEHDNELK